MTPEDRIRASIDAALDDLRTRVEQDICTIVDELLISAATERDEAITVARRTAQDEAAQETQRQVADAEARMRATLDAAVTDARRDEREQASTEVRRLAALEAEQKIVLAQAAAETRTKQALADAAAQAEQAIKDSVRAAQLREREAEMAALSRLLESIRGLDGATTLSEVLDALGQAAARESSRAAVLVLRNERLLGWKLSGFGPRDSQPKAIDLGLNEGGVVALAVNAARAITTRDNSTGAGGPEFAELPVDRMGFAVPVIVGGRVVAVVYADSAGGDGREHLVPSGWPEVIEVLARHAARCLEALTVQKPTTSPSPRFWVPPGAPAAGKAAPDPDVPPVRT